MKSERTLNLALKFAIASAVIVFGLYFLNFHGSFSNDSKHWADFGGYVGGVLGPIFAFLAFAGLLETIKQSLIQRELEGLVHSIRQYEQQLNHCSSLIVSCDSPWIWGNDIDATSDLKELPLRTLLESDSIDWEHHLTELRDSLIFRTQKDGTLYQDRDIWLKAKLASEGLFRYLELYKSKGGEESIYNYYYNAYEIQKNRLSHSDWETA